MIDKMYHKWKSLQFAAENSEKSQSFNMIPLLHVHFDASHYTAPFWHNTAAAQIHNSLEAIPGVEVAAIEAAF